MFDSGQNVQGTILDTPFIFLPVFSQSFELKKQKIVG
jgi:hypothetical protein